MILGKRAGSAAGSTHDRMVSISTEQVFGSQDQDPDRFPYSLFKL
jgi:hypothetical protein